MGRLHIVIEKAKGKADAALVKDTLDQAVKDGFQPMKASDASAAASIRSRIRGGPSESRPVGGAGRSSAATISASKQRPAADSGSSEGAAMENGSYTERSSRSEDFSCYRR